MQQQPESGLVPIKDVFDWTFFILGIHTCCLLPFLHCKQGSKQPGMAGLVACVVLIPIAASYYQSPGILTFWWVWLAMTGYRRMETFIVNQRRRKKGFLRLHSLYVGYPWMMANVLPWAKDERTLLAAEPLLVAMIGTLLGIYDSGLGHFISLGFFSLGAIEMLNRAIEIKRAAARDDDIQDMQQETARYR